MDSTELKSKHVTPLRSEVRGRNMTPQMKRAPLRSAGQINTGLIGDFNRLASTPAAGEPFNT